MEYQELFNQLLAVAGSALMILASYAVKQFGNFVEEKRKAVASDNEITKQEFYLVKGLELVQSAVKATNQTMVDALKAKSEDGSLTQEEAMEAFNETRNAIMLSLSKEAKDAIKLVYGDLDAFIDIQIQNYVAKEKVEKTMIELEAMPLVAGELSDFSDPGNL